MTTREKSSCSSCDELRADLAAAEASRDEARASLQALAQEMETATKLHQLSNRAFVSSDAREVIGEWTAKLTVLASALGGTETHT